MRVGISGDGYNFEKLYPWGSKMNPPRIKNNIRLPERKKYFLRVGISGGWNFYQYGWEFGKIF